MGAALGAALFAVLFGGAARAAAFQVVRQGPDAVTVINAAAAETVAEGPVRRVQIVEVRKAILSSGPSQPGYVATVTDYDCRQWRFRWRSVSAYSRVGQQMLHNDNTAADWTPVTGEPEAVAVARIVCDGRAADAVYAAESFGQLVSALMGAWDSAEPAAPPPPEPAPAKAAKPRKTGRR